MGIETSRIVTEAETQLAERKLAAIVIDTLAPAIARVLKLHRDIGPRSSAHTLVKMIQPFTGNDHTPDGVLRAGASVMLSLSIKHRHAP